MIDKTLFGKLSKDDHRFLNESHNNKIAFIIMLFIKDEICDRYTVRYIMTFLSINKIIKTGFF
jgi:hypothetical protein